MQRFLPTDVWIRRLLVPVVVFLAIVSNHDYLPDFWHHLARGRAMVQTGGLVNRDIFTFTVPGEPFQDVNWLSQLIYYGLYQVGGLDLVQVVNALVLALTFYLAIELCRRMSQSLFWSALVGVLLFLGVWQTLTIRPQTFSMLLIVVLFDVLERAVPWCRWTACTMGTAGEPPAPRPVLLIVPPFLLALWTNLHGAFPAGLMLIGCFFLTATIEWALQVHKRSEDSRRFRNRFAQLGLCLAASTLATLVNPYGWNIYRYVGVTSGRSTHRQIEEWLPPSWAQWTGAAFFVSLIVLAVLLVLNWRKQAHALGLGDYVLLACFLLLACPAVRMVLWWMFVLAPVAAKILARVAPQGSEREAKPTVGAGLIFVLLVLSAVFGLPALQRFHPLLVLKQQHRVESDLEDVQAHLRSLRRQGRVFSKLEWGEYLGWTGAPDFTIFMDGRIEIYSDKIWDEYWTITDAQSPDWQDLLDHYRVDALVLDRKFHGQTHPLLAAVESSPVWENKYTAGDAILFVRRAGK